MNFVPSNINQLVDTITQTGLAYSNRYEVLFNIPNGFGRADIYFMKNMMVRCDSIAIPGRSISTSPFRFYGPARNMPYEPIYSGEMTLTMILSSDLRERKFFEDWMDIVCSKSNYKFGYYDDYVTNMEITLTTKSDEPTYRFYVEEAYPKAIGDLQVGYDKDNDFLRQDITLCFRKYTPEYIGLPSPPPQIVQPNVVAAQQTPQPTQPVSPQQFMVSRGGRVYRMGYDGTVNGIYDPQKYQEIMNSSP